LNDADERDALRRLLRARRRTHVEALPPAVHALCFHALPSPVLARLQPGSRVALYAAMNAEAPTKAIALQLAAAGHDLALPRLDGIPPDMHFHAWQPGDPLVSGPFAIDQPLATSPPVAPDVVFVPIIGFDAALNRLGQGGGHYDRALAACPRALRIGLAWSAQQVDAVPVAEWDMPLDIIVTERQFFEREARP
jgi:5-formyltetrahydrofolate cyclo-ligase